MATVGEVPSHSMSIWWRLDCVLIVSFVGSSFLKVTARPFIIVNEEPFGFGLFQ